MRQEKKTQPEAYLRIALFVALILLVADLVFLSYIYYLLFKKN